MKKYQDVAQDRSGNVMSGAVVTVTSYPSGADVSVYAANAVGTDVNPITTDSNGGFSFYAPDGRYTLTITKAGYSTVTVSDVQIFDAVDVAAYADGVTDDTTYLQAALDQGGTVTLQAGKTYLHNSTLTLGDDTLLDLNGATLKYGGAGVQITTATTGVLNNSGIVNGKLNSQTATKTLELYSPYGCRFRDLTIATNLTTSIVIDVLANTAGGTNTSSNRNAAFTTFDTILQTGTCGTMIRLKGDSGTPTVATLLSFHAINADGCAVRGVNFDSWADNVTWSGMQRYSLTANNAVGLEVNVGTPGSNVGTYGIYFHTLAIDTLGAYTGRVAIKLNYCKLVSIENLYNSPEAEGGVVTVTANSSGYRIIHHKDSNGTCVEYSRHVTQAFMAKISAAQTFTGAKTKADFNTEVADIQGNYDATASQFTAPVTGIYRFILNMLNTTGVTLGDVWLFTIEATGSSTQTYRTGRYTIANAVGAAAVEFSTPPMELIAGDVVTAYVTRSSGSGNYVQLNDGTFNFFAGERVH